MDFISISAPKKPIQGLINLPASKSISNRLLIIDTLSKERLQLHNLSIAEDSKLMQQLLEEIQQHENTNQLHSLDCKNAGTVFRFLTALLALTPGTWNLTGSPRMKARPVKILVEALQQLGADIEYLEEKGFPPIVIKGKPLKGGHIRIDGSVSSQYISALLMIAPVLKKGLSLDIINGIASKPYIEMTLGLMEKAGIKSAFEENKIIIPEQHYRATSVTVENDWSAASFWYEIAALSKNAEISLNQLSLQSLQGDSILPSIFEKLGVKTTFTNNGLKLSKIPIDVNHFNFDFKNHPDLSLPVIVTCAALGLEGRFTGLESLKIKESNRLSALQTELMKLGFEIRMNDQLDLFTFPTKISATTSKEIAMINTWSDHRMAMAFTPLAILKGDIKILDPSVTAKSYPHFWEDLEQIGFSCKF